MSPNDVDGMADSVDPAPRGAVLSGSALFAQTCLSENLGTLWYVLKCTCLQNYCHRRICLKGFFWK